MASEREWRPLTAEKFLREDAPREELSSPTKERRQGRQGVIGHAR